MNHIQNEYFTLPIDEDLPTCRYALDEFDITKKDELRLSEEKKEVLDRELDEYLSKEELKEICFFLSGETLDRDSEYLFSKLCKEYFSEGVYIHILSPIDEELPTRRCSDIDIELDITQKDELWLSLSEEEKREILDRELDDYNSL